MSDLKGRIRRLDVGPPEERPTKTAVVTGLLGTVVSVVIGVGVNYLASESRPLPDWLDSEWVSTAVPLLLTALLGIVGSFVMERGRRRPGPPAEVAEPSVQARIEEATEALRLAAGLVNELQAEMQTRMASLERLRAENAEYERLAALRKEEAEAVSRLIETVIDNTHANLTRSGRRDQMLFFVAGLLASIPIGLVVNWLS